VSRTVGIEIGADRMRAVVTGSGDTARTFDVPFTIERVDDVVAQLKTSIGSVRGIGLAIGLAHLHVKQVSLPPVGAAERRRMLGVEPERWFAVPSGSLTAVSLTATGDIALGADGAFVEACVAAFSAWGNVARVEAAPVALARALREEGTNNATAALDAGTGEIGQIEMRDGTLRSVRRARATDLQSPALRSAREGNIDRAFTVALGASLGMDGALDEMLLTPSLERGFVAAQRRRVVIWGAAAAIAVCSAMWAAGVSRDRLRAALETELASSRRIAEPGTMIANRAMALDREVDAIAATTSARPDVLGALAALGVRLPVEAVAQRVRVSGAEWQIEGNAAKATAVLAALAAEPRFERVRFLAPSNRFRDGTQERETFAIAFAVR
jgi:hypothetical protein